MDDAHRRASMLNRFFEFLGAFGIVYLVAIVLLAWEFTIGIKNSINKLYKGHIVLDNRRYSAIIQAGLEDSNESAKHSQADSDHSGLDRRELH